MKVAVIGGGISGLSCAFFLKKYVPWVSSILVLEKHPSKWGGWIKSETKTIPSTHQPFILEHGPRALKPKGFAGFLTSSLIHSLGLESKIIPLDAKDRYLVFNDQLEKVPMNLRDLFLASRNPRSAMYQCLSTLLSEPFHLKLYTHRSSEDETIESYFKRHGLESLLDRVVSALVHGIYAGHPKELGIKSTFSSLKRAESMISSMTLGMLPTLWKLYRENQSWIQNTPMAKDPESMRLWKTLRKTNSLYSLHHGLGTLVHALEHRLTTLPGVELCLNSTPTHMALDASQPSWSLTYQQGSSLKQAQVGHVFITSPPNTLSTILPCLKQFEVPAIDIGLVHIVFRSTDLPLTSTSITSGFGCLVPLTRGPETDPDLLGIIFPGGLPKEPGLSIYTVMFGGHYFQHLSNLPTSDELCARAVRSLARLAQLPSSIEPIFVESQYQKACLPQYSPFFQHKAQQFNELTNASLVGTWYSNAGVQEGIKSAWEAVWKFKLETANT